jgi:hypothetical protein
MEVFYTGDKYDVRYGFKVCDMFLVGEKSWNDNRIESWMQKADWSINGDFYMKSQFKTIEQLREDRIDKILELLISN